eukprot:1160894-Pelagomonas_calceolata.AAC.3
MHAVELGHASQSLTCCSAVRPSLSAPVRRRDGARGVTCSQDLCLDLSKQLCILSLCRGLPRVWGQKSGKIPAKMGSPGSRLPACLTSSDGWALHQEHILGGPGDWGGGKNCSSDLKFGRGNGEYLLQTNQCTIWGRVTFAGLNKIKNEKWPTWNAHGARV